MAKSLLEAMRAAQEKAGVQLIPTKPVQQAMTTNPARRQNKEKAKNAVKTDQKVGVVDKQSAPRSQTKKRRKTKISMPKLPPPSKQPPLYNSPRRHPNTPRSVPAPAPEVRLVYNGTPSLAWKPSFVESSGFLKRNEKLGCKDRLLDSGGTDRELVMGIDFGTSSTKVVISDRSLATAYVVPFLDSPSIGRYLLPSRLAEADGVFTLEEGNTVFRDLKLSMLAFPDRDEFCIRVCAYLALVIRSARAWLFSEYADQYLSVAPVWSLALGQPTDHATSDDSRKFFERLAKVAWQLAGRRGAIGRETCQAAWKQAQTNLPDDDVEIRVMPELTAQIHGFVSSSHFDSQATNIFLLCDVGAGTVDASVFRVEKKPDASHHFQFYTHSVEAHGVMNLHRHRVSWWDEQLGKQPEGASVRKKLDAIRLPTEYGGHTPACFRKYLSGVTVDFLGGMKTPDEDFFRFKVVQQVKGRVLHRLWRDGLLNQQNITGIPFFLCGGGARHALFEMLKTEMQHQPNCTWLSAEHRTLVLPTNLRAPELALRDYDRLSVAYGLSQLDSASVERILPLAPAVPCGTQPDWRACYVDKDAC